MVRYQSLDAFWPYYLSEHRSPTSRALHFVGTTWFFGMVGASLVRDPWLFPLALVLFGALGAFAATQVEPRRAAVLPLVGMVAIATAASPVLIPAGVVGAYACAWAGHFRIEKNRPATFTYPVWSFLCDFRMWSHMVRGRLWRGDPLQELGLQVRAPGR